MLKLTWNLEVEYIFSIVLNKKIDGRSIYLFKHSHSVIPIKESNSNANRSNDYKFCTHLEIFEILKKGNFAERIQCFLSAKSGFANGKMTFYCLYKIIKTQM